MGKELRPIPCPFCGQVLTRTEDDLGVWWTHSENDVLEPEKECIVGQITIAEEDVPIWNRRPPSEQGQGGELEDVIYDAIVFLEQSAAMDHMAGTYTIDARRLANRLRAALAHPQPSADTGRDAVSPAPLAEALANRAVDVMEREGWPIGKHLREMVVYELKVLLSPPSKGAPKEDGWIDIRERLPTEEEDKLSAWVLCWGGDDDYKRCEVGRITYGTKHPLWLTSHISPTHWMPLSISPPENGAPAEEEGA